MSPTIKIAVISTDSSTLPKALELASRLQLPFIEHKQTAYPFLLAVTPGRLELRETTIKNSKPLFVDFLTPQLTYRIKHGGGKKQLLAKAIGIKKERLVVIDATAGFGVDAFILSSLGCEVLMLERSPIIGELLKDGLERLKQEQKVQPININLQETQAVAYLSNLVKNNLARPDVVYLDPMYPKRQKLALNKKNMRILHELVGNDDDAPELLNLALKCAKKRVVIKRPKYAGALGELKPDLQFSASGSCRYDVYFSIKIY